MPVPFLLCRALMMRMSDKLESLLSEGMDDAEGDAAEGVYRNLALRYAAQLEECCQLLYGEDVAAELGIQSDGMSVERWNCGGQFLVDVIGRWVFGPSFWIKEHLWRLSDGPSSKEGRVEIFHEGVWGTICDDGWGVKNAHVVCRSLGFGEATGAPMRATYGQGSGPIWLDNVSCDDDDERVDDCASSGWVRPF